MKDLPDLNLPEVGEPAVTVEQPALRRARMECTLSTAPNYGTCSATVSYLQKAPQFLQDDLRQQQQALYDLQRLWQLQGRRL